MTKKPFTQRQIKKIKQILLQDGKTRDYLLLSIALELKIKNCYLLRLQVEDLCYLEIDSDTIVHAIRYANEEKLQNKDYLFSGNGRGQPITRVHCARIIKSWCLKLGLERGDYSTKSLFWS